MAKFQVGTGIDQYMAELRNLEQDAPEAIGKAIYQGAKIITDEIKGNIQQLSTRSASDVERAGLLDGLGISKMEDDSGYWNVKVGFDGYNAQVTKKYPKGHPNSMIARSIESGTSFRPKNSFVSAAVRNKKGQAEEEMAKIIDDYIKNSMK